MAAAHVFAFLASLGIILTADKQAVAWVRGKKALLDGSFLRKLHLLLWATLGVQIATGAVLAYPMRAYLLGQPLFILKLLFVAILVLNAILIGRLMPAASERTFASLSFDEKLPFLMSGAISGMSWAAAAILALAAFS